ncbi:MAG: EAL domain-containing protein [Butyrivibrio sp.]|nr:EAL domain-containing protein [Butyrivibrio sp.]
MNGTVDNSEISKYVISHIDDAIANEWIKIYYQPVIRSITGQLSGAESLARWIDPEVGFLAPDKFIGALEKSKNIHKLDCFIVNKVCSDIHQRMSDGLPTVPVSVNFSRLDFIMCDMLDVVETAVAKYNIPRDFIHIEITESMIVQDEDLMSEVIRKFRDKGYEVWMDDFGSGYSSLTLLKDYHFELLKLDMRFLSDMSEKAKTIIHSVIGMAKRLEIKTLSEGVETKEQVDFLLSIGCGKFQGYYFGKPAPLVEMLASIEEKNITVEERQWRSFYEEACLAMRDLNDPLSIVEFDGNSFKTLYMNAPFKQQLNISTADLDIINKTRYSSASPLISKYREFAKELIKTKGSGKFYYTDNGSYFQLYATYITETDGKYLFKTRVSNISIDQNTVERNNLDQKLRELNHLHEAIILINLRERLLSPMLGAYIYMSDLISERVADFDKALDYFTNNLIYPADRDAFAKFSDTNTILDRIRSQEHGFVKNTFRIKQRDGSFEWRMCTLLPIPGTEGNEILLTISIMSEDLAAALDAVRYPKEALDGGNIEDIIREYAVLWKNVMDFSALKFFWKDKDRRFRGVSKSFLDFYEIKSLDDIIGKNDEEMHWHVDDAPYQGDELDVLHKGKVVFNAEGQCIVNGVVHNIICNKMPIYDKGEIVGLMGSFTDIEQELYRTQKLVSPSKLDSITRLMNNKDFVITMVDYAMQYNDAGKNYGYILMHNPNHHRIEEAFGSKFAAKVLKEIAERIIDVIGQKAVASRTKESYFAIMVYIDSKEKLEELAKKLKEHIDDIHFVDGNSVTIRMTVANRLRTEPGVTDENIHQLVTEEIEKNES